MIKIQKLIYMIEVWKLKCLEYALGSVLNLLNYNLVGLNNSGITKYENCLFQFYSMNINKHMQIKNIRLHYKTNK